jgi:clan AA aspartic protease
LFAAEKGWIKKKDIKSLVINMWVDSGAAMVCLPSRMISELGLEKKSEKQIATTSGYVLSSLYSPVTISILDREIELNIMEIPDGVPPLLGSIALEAMNLVVNPRKQIVESNPQQNGKYFIGLI